MKSTTECRYWNEFYHYEQWLIDNDLLSSNSCYSMTHQMGDEYLIGLCGYIEMMKKRYKKNTMRVKVSRLFTCMRKTMNNNMIIWLEKLIRYEDDWN